jgi:hypothetical protein
VSNAIAWVKSHPILSTVFFVFVVIALYLITRGGGSGNAVASGRAGKTAADIQEDQINAQLQAIQLQSSAALQAKQADIAGQITLSSNQFAAQLQAAEIAADVRSKEIAANEATTAATLTAQQNIATLQADVTSEQIQSQADVIQAQTEAARDTQLATIGYFTTRDTGEQNIELASIQAQRDVALQKLTNEGIVYSAATTAATARGAESTGWSQVISALFKTGTPPPDSYAGTGGFSIGIPGVGSFGYKG